MLEIMKIGFLGIRLAHMAKEANPRIVRTCRNHMYIENSHLEAFLASILERRVRIMMVLYRKLAISL